MITGPGRRVHPADLLGGNQGQEARQGGGADLHGLRLLAPHGAGHVPGGQRCVQPGIGPPLATLVSLG
jgi:hypothetical protein